MIEKISSWASGIVVAVIIATLLELLLPEGKNKKYIKTVIGIYILFTIISPIITAFEGENFNLQLKMEEYINTSIENQDFSINLNTDEQVADLCKTNIETDITSKIKERGYIVDKILLEIELKDENNYGRINQLNLQISKKEQQTDEIKTINTITIGENSQSNSKGKQTISESEIVEIKEYLSNVYDTNIKNITINDR